jgi:hypothetical protein
MRRLRTFLALEPAQRRAFLEALAWIWASRIRLPVLGLARALRGWRHPAQAGAAWPAAARWIGIASRYCPGGGNCLVRSLALYGALRRAGVAAELRIGVGKTAPHLEAHAWIEVDGVPANDAADVATRYAPFGDLHAVPGRP